MTYRQFVRAFWCNVTWDVACAVALVLYVVLR